MNVFEIFATMGRMSIYPVFFAILPVVSTFVGGYVVYRWKRDLHPWLSLSGGVLLGVAFLDLLPEALEYAAGEGVEASTVLFFTLGAIIFLHLIDTLFRFHGHHEHAHGEPEEPCGNELHKKTQAWIRAGGFIFHSLCDGLAIGGGFAVDTRLGLLVMMAVVLHGFSDGMSTVAILRSALGHRGHDRKIIATLILVAIAPFIGSFIGFAIAPSVTSIAFLLATFAGLFIFLSLSELLPQAHAGKQSRGLGLSLTILGVVVVFVVRAIAPV